MQANREAPTLEFKSNKNEIARSSTTAALAAKFTPDNDMEEEVAELLRAAGAHTGEAVEEAEEALALKVGYSRHYSSSLHAIRDCMRNHTQGTTLGNAGSRRVTFATAAADACCATLCMT